MSKHYIVAGAVSGSIYFFERIPCRFLQLIPNSGGAINLLAISPQEQFIAFTTQKGVLHIYRIDLTTVQPPSSSYYHQTNITQIKWKHDENQVFFGDMKGSVCPII